MQLAFADWANLDGEFFPTYKEIADKARITKPGAIGIVQSMIADREIELLQHGGSGRGRRNRYRFAEKYRVAVRELSDKWSARRADRVKKDNPSATQKVKQDDPLKVNEDDPFTPKKVNEDNPSRVKQDDPISAKRVNEDAEKGKRGMTHVRNNPSCIPSKEELPSKEEEGAAPAPFENFADTETEMAKAVSSVMGLADVPEGDHAQPIFDAAREFVAAGISASDVGEFERDFYARKNAQGKRYVLTLKILRGDLPAWVRARRFQSDSSRSSAVEMPPWRKRLLGLS